MVFAVQLFSTLILPIFLMLGTGYLLQKRLGLDLNTLSRVNLYLFIPSLAFTEIYQSTTPLYLLGIAALGTLGIIAVMLGVGWGTARLTGEPRPVCIASAASAAFYNSGNYGLPLVSLAFHGSPYAMALQTIVVAVQNIATFTVGLAMMAAGKQTLRESLRSSIQYPFLYMLLAALLFRAEHWTMPQPVLAALTMMGNALVPVALVTLGAQLARISLGRGMGRVSVATAVRLIGGPVVAYGIIRLFGLHGQIAQSLLISSGVPTAVNVTILAIQYDTEPEFVSQTTFLTTLCSALTMTVVVTLAFRQF